MRHILLVWSSTWLLLLSYDDKVAWAHAEGPADADVNCVDPRLSAKVENPVHDDDPERSRTKGGFNLGSEHREETERRRENGRLDDLATQLCEPLNDPPAHHPSPASMLPLKALRLPLQCQRVVL